MSPTISLPVELIEIIIGDVWYSPLSKDERITFMTSSVLVGKEWLGIFIHFSSKDVHVPCASYVDQFLRILRGDSCFFPKGLRVVPDALCRSITVSMHGRTPHPAFELHEPPMWAGQALGDLLYSLSATACVPQLRTLRVEYTDMGYDDFFHNFRAAAFPAQITEVGFVFAFSRETPWWLVEGLRANHGRREEEVHVTLPNVRRLCVVGGSDGFVADAVVACPGLVTLGVDVPLNLESEEDRGHSVVLRQHEQGTYQNFLRYMGRTLDGEAVWSRVFFSGNIHIYVVD